MSLPFLVRDICQMLAHELAGRWWLSASLLCCIACNSGTKPTAPASVEQFKSPFLIDPADVPRQSTEIKFKSGLALREIASAVGLNHTYNNGATGRVLIVETIGGGCGWLDYDNDGRWDVVFNQGGDPTTLDRRSQPLDKLFRNLSTTGFRDVTASARFTEPNYGQAVAVADYDDDGFDDFYISNVFANTLWHNCGDGTFQEVGTSSGTADPRWSTSAAWADLDRDGDLDLYVCNYTVYDPTHPVECKDAQGRDSLCYPTSLEPAPDACYMNQGDGTFAEQARQRGLFGLGNRALGVAAADFNNDGWPDLYVANDTTANFLFVNKGQAVFENRAEELGCAVDREGSSQASMGVAVADFDRNGWLDLYCTNYYEESNTLYANYGPQGFQDVTAFTGLHRPTLAFLGFGTIMQDLDQDGRMDVFIANGHVDNAPSNSKLQMQAQIFSYVGNSWIGLEATAGDYFRKKFLGRGVATCDIDDDGDLDLAVLNQNDLAALLRNDSRRGNWIKLAFRGIRSNRRGIGCRVVVRARDITLTQELCGGTSYASAHQPVCVFGLGDRAEEVSIQVKWPSGIVQNLESIPVNQALLIEER